MSAHSTHEGQPDEETWRTQGQEGHSGVVWVPCCDNNTEKYKVGMEAIKDMSEDAYNFLTKTHSVSDWAASQFKYDHYGVTASSWCESLHSVYTRRHFKEA